MEVTTKPGLNAPVFPDQLDKLFALLLIRVIQPTAPVDHVIFLQHPQSRSVGWGVSEDEDLPSLLGRVGLNEVLEPVDLGLVDGDFVRGVNGIPENGGSESDEECFVCDLTAELGCFFSVGFEVEF